jgi:hypothetical protein
MADVVFDARADAGRRMAGVGRWTVGREGPSCTTGEGGRSSEGGPPGRRVEEWRMGIGEGGPLADKEEQEGG